MDFVLNLVFLVAGFVFLIKGADLFDDTGYDSEDLYTMVKELYEASPYSLEVPKISPMRFT